MEFYENVKNLGGVLRTPTIMDIFSGGSSSFSESMWSCGFFMVGLGLYTLPLYTRNSLAFVKSS